MYWDTLIVLGIYLSLQLIMGILTLIFTDQPGSRKTDVGIRLRSRNRLNLNDYPALGGMAQDML